jgi:hypothetical protein
MKNLIRLILFSRLPFEMVRIHTPCEALSACMSRFVRNGRRFTVNRYANVPMGVDVAVAVSEAWIPCTETAIWPNKAIVA